MAWNFKLKLILLAMLFFGQNLVGQNNDFTNHEFEPFEMVVMPKSSVSIAGSTNISTFQCNYAFPQTDTILAYSKKINDHYSFSNSIIPIQVNLLHCGNPLITSDLKSALEVDLHPNISIEVKEISNSDPSSTADSTSMLAHSNLKIKGINKPIQVGVDRVRGRNQILKFKGKFKVYLSEFGIKKIEKAGGLIEVKDIVEINYDIWLWLKKNAP